ncbi:MAG TPA: UDP-N-acetylglucosamine 1-carboxyvinyltransferase [Methylomirabilota bacterium]|nr:UDP-N-acetylglucosamine 1-carboxyvinyltransferase [Methylomirabilota bacterium]
MSKFIITGQAELAGEIRVQGSKNAMFPVLAAALLTEEECKFTNVPQILDREVFCALIEKLGARVKISDHTVVICAKDLKNHELDPSLASKLRGSIVLLGALLGRLGKAKMAFPGGDIIGKRPVNSHLRAFEKLGAETSTNGAIEINASQLKGNKIILEESSVTATENAVLASVLAQGRSIIKLAAMEPHVQQLCEFLNSMGAKISGIGTTTLEIEGVKKLHGAEVALIPDSNEAASFITLAAATKSQIKITDLNPDYLDDFLLKLEAMNVQMKIGKDFVQVYKPDADYQATKIQCGLYPKMASDDMPPMAVLATQAQGESLIYEWLYENRLGYVEQLIRMGANAQILDPHRVKITGPTPLKSAKIESLDIRMGMTLVIAALVAEGISEIDGIDHVDRGYEKLEERLNKLGADIKRIA